MLTVSLCVLLLILVMVPTGSCADTDPGATFGYHTHTEFLYTAGNVTSATPVATAATTAIVEATNAALGAADAVAGAVTAAMGAAGQAAMPDPALGAYAPVPLLSLDYLHVAMTSLMHGCMQGHLTLQWWRWLSSIAMMVNFSGSLTKLPLTSCSTPRCYHSNFCHCLCTLRVTTLALTLSPHQCSLSQCIVECSELHPKPSPSPIRPLSACMYSLSSARPKPKPHPNPNVVTFERVMSA